MENSLITTPSTSGSARISPGWVLYANPYLLERSERKYRQRKKSMNYQTDISIMRPSIVDMVLAARQRLLLPATNEDIVVITAPAIPGLGSCQMLEDDLFNALNAYNDYLERYALRGLFTRMQAGKDSHWRSAEALVEANDGYTTPQKTNASDSLKGVLADVELMTRSQSTLRGDASPSEDQETEEARWLHEKSVLRLLYPSIPSTPPPTMSELCESLIGLEKVYCETIYKCRDRDARKGKLIIPEYEESHLSADDDPIVLDVRYQTESWIRLANNFLTKL